MKKYSFSVILFCIVCISYSQILKGKKLTSFKGFYNFHYEESTDKIFLEVKDLDTEFLYVNALATGIGSNDIGLDRGQLGQERVVYFKKAGNKLLLMQPNLKYRAETTNTLEKQSIDQAFAKSVLYGFDIIEEENGTYIIDMTPFLMQDAHGVANRLKSEGTYTIDLSKSALALERTKAFPKNVEFEALLTFSGEVRGNHIKSVTPTPNLVSVIQHHSFIALPDNNYKMRKFDVRSGAISMSYFDYATPIQDPIEKRYIIRHRLEKKNPKSEVSEAKEPIVYYLDPGTPEPVRTALLEGARWWNEAFESIGFKDAFQVKMLPENADPMDCRYNVIQWVHRSTRGWSYGASVVDPRTGEIIKGHVSLGSLRIRQDFLIAQALMNKPFAERDDNVQPMLNMALARIRQLSAHEVGHTLGFAHNFAASTNNRSSVMDYPHPLIKLKNNQIDFSDAYAEGIGDWDKVTVAYSYSEFQDYENESDKLNLILKAAAFNGHQFISDADARAKGGAHALAHLWDNGTNPSSELERVLEIRQIAIENFSEDNIRINEPYSVLEDVFVPLYFFHRYQTEATVKLIGGLDYNYAVKDGGTALSKPIKAQLQFEALGSILKTLSAQTLAIPKDKLELFPPRAYEYGRTRESFKGKTGVAFDPLSATVTASDMTLALLLHPERANRLILRKSLDPNQLSLEVVLQSLSLNFVNKALEDPYQLEVQLMINERILYHLMNLLASDTSFFKVKAQVSNMLDRLFNELLIASEYKSYYEHMINQYREHPEKFKLKSVPKIPDGSPIGTDYCNYFQD